MTARKWPCLKTKMGKKDNGNETNKKKIIHLLMIANLSIIP